MRFEQLLYAIPLSTRSLFGRQRVEQEREEDHFQRKMEESLARVRKRVTRGWTSRVSNKARRMVGKCAG